VQACNPVTTVSAAWNITESRKLYLLRRIELVKEIVSYLLRRIELVKEIVSAAWKRTESGKLSLLHGIEENQGNCICCVE
jgi:hypothetical protein